MEQEQVLGSLVKRYGIGSKSSRAAIEQLDKTLSGLNDWIGVRSLRERLLSSRRSSLGDDHEQTVDAMISLANVCWRMGDFYRASRLDAEALEISRRAFGEEHPLAVEAASYTVRDLITQGRCKEAKALVAHAVEIARRVRPEDDKDREALEWAARALTKTRLRAHYWAAFARRDATFRGM